MKRRTSPLLSGLNIAHYANVNITTQFEKPQRHDCLPISHDHPPPNCLGSSEWMHTARLHPWKMWIRNGVYGPSFLSQDSTEKDRAERKSSLISCLTMFELAVAGDLTLSLRLKTHTSCLTVSRHIRCLIALDLDLYFTRALVFTMPSTDRSLASRIGRSLLYTHQKK